MGQLQDVFSTSANSMMDNAGTLSLMNAKVNSLTIPKDFSGNPDEFKRRSLEGLQRLMGDEYMLSIQNKTKFDLETALHRVSKNETPTSLNEKAATIENRVITAGEKIDPTRRLTNGTETQQQFLERASTALREEKIKTGSVSADGAIKDFAKNAPKLGLQTADIVNYAGIEGVAIPQETMNKLAATPVVATLAAAADNRPVVATPAAAP